MAPDITVSNLCDSRTDELPELPRLGCYKRENTLPLKMFNFGSRRQSAFAVCLTQLITIHISLSCVAETSSGRSKDNSSKGSSKLKQNTEHKCNRNPICNAYTFVIDGAYVT